MLCCQLFANVFFPHSITTDPQKWKHQSPALQKAAATFKTTRLEKSNTDKDKFLRFISLCDTLVLGQLCSLARSALSLCLFELKQPRKVGLFLMVGYVDDTAAAAAVAKSAVATASAMSAVQQPHSSRTRQTGGWADKWAVVGALVVWLIQLSVGGISEYTEKPSELVLAGLSSPAVTINQCEHAPAPAFLKTWSTCGILLQARFSFCQVPSRANLHNIVINQQGYPFAKVSLQ